mmetsp:Transcript_6739/g.15599  ORF Transcript_6739/g.15599 Transcript_6739/m.15599 type:complete len:213 (-) Transcript_6739:646-1284(-)
MRAGRGPGRHGAGRRQRPPQERPDAPRAIPLPPAPVDAVAVRDLRQRRGRQSGSLSEGGGGGCGADAESVLRQPDAPLLLVPRGRDATEVGSSKTRSGLGWRRPLLLEQRQRWRHLERGTSFELVVRRAARAAVDGGRVPLRPRRRRAAAARAGEVEVPSCHHPGLVVVDGRARRSAARSAPVRRRSARLGRICLGGRRDDQDRRLLQRPAG